MDYDVIIIGAGISGLYAASLLKAYGLNLLVLEGRDRVAGRQWTYRADNIGYTDMGGAYVGKQQTKVLSVLDELGLKTYKINSDQKSTITLKSGLQLFKPGIPSFKSILVLMDLNHFARLVDELRLEVPIEAPWDAEKAETLDAVTVEQFIDRNIWTKDGKVLCELLVTSLYGVEPSKISLLFFLHEIRCSGSFQAVFSISDGLQELKIDGGSGQISERLAESLKGQLKLNHLVSQVAETENGLRVTTDTGNSFTAKRVISSVPLPGLFDIEFSPALPKYISWLSEVKPACQIMKTFMFYDRAFWRDHGLNCELLAEIGVVTSAIDDTNPDGSHPVILGLIDANKAKKYSTLSLDERKALICKQYATCFGLEEFLHPTHYVEKYWQSDEEQKYGRGCGLWSLPPGVLTGVRKLVSPKEPFGNIFFTGTETALTFKGYMDGALRSAHCASAQVSKSLGLPFDYDEAEYSADVPYLKPSTVQKYLPRPKVFMVGSVISLVALLLGIGLWLYFTLS